MTIANTASLDSKTLGLSVLEITARRDVKGMTAILAELRPEDRLAVTFRTPRYGVFTVCGKAVRSVSVNTFMIGSLFIETNGKPDKTVMSLGSGDVAATVNAPETGDGDRDQLQLVVDDLVHGDLVEATFVQQPHGCFSITGVAVQTADGAILAVGSWFIAQGGHAASRLRALTRLASAGNHRVPVPSRLSAWENDDDTASSGRQ